MHTAKIFIRSCQGPAYLYSFKAVLFFHSCLVSKKASAKAVPMKVSI